MTLNKQKRWGLIALAALLVVALGTILWRARREPEFVYQGKPVRAWVRRAVMNDYPADASLQAALRTADPVSKAQIKKELVRFVMKPLRTKDHPLWPPYNAVRTSLPPAVARLMPRWEAPSNVRAGALWWLYFRAIPWDANSAPPRFSEQATPVLCDLALNDPNKEIRHAATLALGRVGTFSPEASQILLGALNSADYREIMAAAEWFRRHPVDPEQVIPLLIQHFEDPSGGDDCALALRTYGPRAKFAAERLITLAGTDNPWVSSNATWVLQAIDPEAAKKARVLSP
jgi:hypothetical protein